MAEVSVYTFEDADGNEVGSGAVQDPKEARAHASRYGYRVREHTYEWADSTLVPGWDFTRGEEPA